MWGSISASCGRVFSNAQSATDEILESEGESSDNDDEINAPLDNVYEDGSDNFSDTGFIDREEMIREDAGVRGPQSI